MNKYLFKEKKILFVYIILIILDAINIALMAYFLKYSLDVTGSKDYGSLNKACIIVFIYLLFYSFISWCTRRIKALYITKTMNYLKQDLFDSIMKFNYHKFYETDYSNYLSTFNNDINLIEKNYFDSISIITKNIVILILSCIMLIYIQPTVALIGILLSVLPFVVTKVFENKLAESTSNYSNSLKEYNAVLKDNFMGFETIKSFLIESNMTHLHQSINTNVEENKKKSYYVKANSDVATNFIAIGSQFAVYLVSGYFVIQGSITMGGVIAITQLMYKVVNPVFDIIQSTNNIKSVKKIAEDIQSILKYQPQNENLHPLSNLNNGILFDQVNYQYKESSFALKDISLEFEKGKKYAIVGESGSGKSTLIRLLLGYYKNYSGKILLDDYDLLSLSTESIYQLFSVMHQNVFLFDDTIANNITLYNHHTREEIVEVIEKVGLSNYINNLPCNMDSRIEGNGINLSGGEKQRVALARVLLKGSGWIIMDEATSSLDNETCMLVENQVLSLENISCITVTHRYNKNILEKYDKIFVFKNGEIVEQGNFSELMSRGKLFYSLYTIFE